MIHGKKARFSTVDNSYLKKTHHCPHCNAKMKKAKIKKVVNSRSPEASQYNFTSAGSYPGNYTSMVGNIEFTFWGLECARCGCQMTADEMRQYEYLNLSDAERRKIDRGNKFWGIFFGIIIFSAVALCIVVSLCETGHLPQNVAEFLKSVIPEALWEILKGPIEIYFHYK